MQTTLKKLIGGAALGLALLANTAPTWAGLKVRAEVFVGSSFANGSMTSARYSSDTKQQISCFTTGSNLYAVTNAYCSAYDKTGVAFACTTSNPKLVAAVSSITSSSFIAFSAMDANAFDCSSIYVDNSSVYLK